MTSRLIDDVVGSFSCEFQANVHRSLYNGVNAAYETAIHKQNGVDFLREQATPQIISANATQETAQPQRNELTFKYENGLRLSVEKLSDQDVTFTKDSKTTFKHKQATPLARILNANVDIATARFFAMPSDLQQMIPLDWHYCFNSEDVNDATHIFKAIFQNDLLEQFHYFPTHSFTFENLPTSRVFDLYSEVYIPPEVESLQFNLYKNLKDNPDFNLGVDDETMTPVLILSRIVFDSFSTYTPTANFVYGFTQNQTLKIESVQRGGYRLSKTAGVTSATKKEKKSCFKSEPAITKWNIRQWWRDLIIEKPPIIVYPPEPPRNPNPNNETFTIPIKTVYIMQNSILITLTDETPIDVADVSLNLDADSWAWQFSCKLLNPAQMSLVTQTNDMPVELLVTINGFTWKVLCEKITHTKTFAKNEIGLSGRSLSALLTQPYLQPRSATQSDLLTVQQLAELELPNGWTIDWQAATWNVPAGAFSYTAKTPMQVISEIAADIGAMVVPSRNSKTLKITPRYPVLPWQFDQAVPNLVIPDSALQSLTYRAVIPAQANGVYVHGGEIGGVIGWCRLTGTDGARLSQTVNNALMTNVIGCRALGERILAGQYTQPALQSVTLPMNATDMPLANVGDLIRVNVDGSQVRGIVNSVSISASLGNVSQTLQIGEETANVWSAFKQILPQEPLLVGMLSSTDGATSLMTLIDGGVVRVRGTGSVNAKYYIRAGRIENEAPNLVLSEIVV